jgi:5'-nucleotidase/UDP-sugar diphosphatase
MGTTVGTRQGLAVGRVHQILPALLAAAGLALGACEEEEPRIEVDAATSDAGSPDRPPADGGTDSARADGGDAGPSVTLNLTILHTNDLHSHLWGHAPEADYTPLTTGDDMTVGGFARLAAAIKTQRAAAGANVLLLDGGDFLMGTPFHIAAFSAAPELKLMQAVGYDAAAIGNHEFDFTPAGLAAVLAAARTERAFPLLATNMKFSTVSTEDDSLAAFAAEPNPLIRTKLVKTLPNGLKVGMFGLLGVEAQRFAAAARPLTFDTTLDTLAAAARAAVNDLRTNDKVDVVIALSHSGINAAGKGEDQALAGAAAGIDVIVSGHTHDKLMQPATVGKTVIVTAGSFGEYLGRLDLDVVKQGATVSAVNVKKYELIAIDDSIAGDVAMQTAVETFITGLDMALGPSMLSYKKVVAETTFDLKRASVAESGLGDLVADAYLAAGRAAESTELADFAVEASGEIRGDLLKGTGGQLWFSDVFQVVPLGTGLDKQPGRPLISYYLNGADIRGGLEVGAAADAIGDSYFLQLAGIEVDYSGSKIPFDRVTGARLVKEGMAPVAIDFANTTKCYKVVSTLYIAALFGVIEGLTNGKYSVKPKLKDCATVVTDLFSLRIDANPAMAEVQELKQYQALLQLLLSFPDVGGTAMVPNIPARYMASQQRIKRTP